MASAASAADAGSGAPASTPAIAALQKLGILDGEADGMSAPDAPITRGQAAIVLRRALKLETQESGSAFDDVPAGSEMAEAVAALKKQGVVSGYGKSYKPGNPLTKEQMATLLSRAFHWSDNGIQVQYSDMATIAKVHQADAVRLKQQFIVDGSVFDPRGQVTHGQFAQALYRALELDLRGPGYIPLEDFIRQPAQVGFQVSPDGKRLAYLQPWNNRMNVFVKTIGDTDETRVTGATERNIMGFAWANDNKIIYAADNGGNENFHIYSINLDGSEAKDLTPYENTTAGLIDQLKEDPDHILVAMNKRDPRLFDVYRININTGAAELAAENPGNISGWLTDHDGKIRVAFASDGNISTVLYREKEDQAFQPVLTTEIGDTFTPVGFTYDDKQLYVVSNIGRDKTALIQYDPATKQNVSTIYENPDSDVVGIIPADSEQKILAVMYETDKVHYHFLDPKLESLYNKFKNKVPGREASILNVDAQGKAMFYAYGDKSMGAYYSYDSSTDKLELLADVSPWLDESKLADMKPVSFQSRDGLTIHGYLTLPKGADPKSLPLVVNPHGGPWARDSWGYNPEVQLLANRGYAVLQVNFRGSTGYGKSFLNAGNKQWGKAMQNDLTDGVQWLVKEGIADPKRVAIYGASYGGYAALAGLTFTPDVYAAGVSYVGPSNLFTLLETIPPYWESQKALFHERMGDPVLDKDLLTAVSPLFHADQIRAPLFVAQGANDPRVNKAESDQIVNALRQRNVDVPYMLKQNEGHGFANIENQLDFYRALEKFLHRHLME
ncbi:prolyl oligopeptidase family serine peptidase [Cohnella sp. CFH 77786]|nr:prolyl oligopeptidase family serine peptidase [Cohnella sp. CFH 77786]